MGTAKGIVFILLWYSSIAAGYVFFFGPLLPIMFLSHYWFRTIIDYIYSFWQIYVAVIMEILFNVKINITGDEIRADETSLLIMNHRTRVDWAFVWPAMYYTTIGKGRLKYPIKIVLKDAIKHIPGPGWVMQVAGYLFIRRCWEDDEQRISRTLDYFCDIRYKFSLLLFPEGTDLTADTKKKSDSYAEKNSLQKYDYVLHPRTKGFAYIANKLMGRKHLDAVYDITIVYCDHVPQTEADIVRGRFPSEIKMHFNRYEASSLPQTEEGLKTFLERRWQEKERMIREFHSSRHFLHGKRIGARHPLELYGALVFWSLLPFLAVDLLLLTPLGLYMLLGSFVLIALGVAAEGFNTLELFVFDVRRRILPGPFL